MRVPHPPDVVRADRHGHARGVGDGDAAQHAGAEDRRLDEKRRIGVRGLAPEQLRGQERPRRVGVGAVRVHAREAGGASGDDEGTDAHPIARQLDRQVHDVGGHQPGSTARIQHPLGDDDHGKARGRRRALPTRQRRDVDTGGPPPRLERFVAGHAETLGDLQPHDRRRRVVGDERPADAGREPLGVVAGGAHRARERNQHRIGDAVGQRVEQSLLPAGDIVHAHRLIGPQLQAGGRAPQGRVGGGQSEHAPIMPASHPRRARCPQARFEIRRIGRLWRRR